MFGLMGRELGAECWLLTGLGRVVGGTGTSLTAPLALVHERASAEAKLRKARGGSPGSQTLMESHPAG